MQNVHDNSILLGLVALAGLVILGLLFLLGSCAKQIRHWKLRAETDPVTGGLNEAGLTRKAGKFLEEEKPQYAVVAMEVANYQQYLHAFGRNRTNQMLKHVYNVLKANLSGAEPVARLFGGTFCFLMKNRQEQEIRVRLMRMAECEDQFCDQNGAPYRIGLRFVSLIPTTPGESLPEIREKLRPLLESSGEGDEQVRFYRGETGMTLSMKWEMLRQMERSMAAGDFLIYLQPKVRLSDGRIAGAEAMLRWKNPRRGMLTYEMFSPLLEEYQLVSHYGIYLFEQVCRQMARWDREGKEPCPVSIMLSHEEVGRKDFLTPYLQITQKYGIAPERIQFELGKTFQQRDTRQISRVVKTLHDHHFRCALNHFGGKTVQLHLLRELDVDAVKLDYSFFTSENNNRRNRYVVEAILKIASQMQIQTIAEGIENASQVKYLKNAGCDMVQGYHYFQPMAPEEFAKTVYRGGRLGYAAAEAGQEAASAGQGNASGNIAMFSMLRESDCVVFSNPFSPVLGGKTTIPGAAALFRHSELIHENDRKDFFRLIERCRQESGWVENVIRFYTATGRYEWLEVHLHQDRLGSTGETVITGTLVNVAGWKNEVNRWKEKANRDALTGLYNREYFERITGETLEKDLPGRAAIIFVDIDDFKNVNDTLGHTVGDDVICWFAKRILGAFRHSDIVARYGGDEFVVFVNGIGRRELESRLQQLCDGFRFPYRNADTEYAVSGSVGAAMFPEDGASYQKLLDHADSALYEAKRQGKNRFVFYQPGLESGPRQ